MADKRISDLIAATDAHVNDGTRLMPLCDPATGISEKMTIAQAKAAFGSTKFKYVATGAEGTALMISAVSGKTILLIAREGAIIYEVSATPDPAEYIWDGSTITLGLTVNPAGGERFNILFRNT